MSMEPLVLDVCGSPRFCMYWHPRAGEKVRGAVLYVHPFAEEMNKSRRMAALQSRRLAEAGWAVLQVDLFGCGDSAGDFEDASVEQWESDLDAAADWLRERHGDRLTVWGLRLGASLCAYWIARTCRRDRIARALLWQPVVSGARHLNQFLRVALAADRTTGDRVGPTTAELRARLAGGETLEVGGYRVSSALAGGLNALNLDTVPAPGVPVDWIEVMIRNDSTLGEDARRVTAQWHGSGATVEVACVQGDPFWATAEVVECEALLCATTKALL